MFEIFLKNAFYLYKTYAPQREAIAINEFREIIVNNLICVLKQPAHLRPVCGFHYLEVLPPTEKKKIQSGDASIATKWRSGENLVTYVGTVKTDHLSPLIAVLGFTTATYKSELLKP